MITEGGCLWDHVFPFSPQPFDGVLPTEGKMLHPPQGGYAANAGWEC